MRARFIGFVTICFVAGCGGAALSDFTSEADNFKAKMPGTPKQQTQSVKGFSVKTYTVESRDGGMIVSVTDMSSIIPPGESDEKIQDRLDGSQAGAVGNIGASLINSQKRTLGKHSGREFSANLPNNKGKMRSRIYLVDRKLYQVMVIGTASHADSANATGFLESFALLK
ncbi:MAG: hypothetical protein L0Y72_28580 [Gemmataceae bacterium]|nr:hypothetical protein [Gemmataceae bacterium]MCI0743004.1 hypothetical protein [Gemmataceae bacterium]